MPVQIRIDGSLSELSPGADVVQVQAKTVGEALVQAARLLPGLGARLLNCEGELRSVFRLTHNGSAAEAADPLEDGDVLVLALASADVRSASERS